MIGAFRRGGSQDYQRGRRYGVPDHETNPVVKDSASYNLGEVTELTNVPNVFGKIGGGIENIFREHSPSDSDQYGMEKGDAINFDAGVLAVRSYLHKSALAIGRAHSTTVAPIPKNGSGKQSSARAPTYASTGALQLDITKINKIAAAVFLVRKNAEFSAVAAIGRRFYFSPSNNFTAAQFVSKTAKLAQAHYSASTAAGMLKVARQSAAAGMFGGFLQNRPSFATSLNRGLPVSIAPIGGGSQRGTEGANMVPGSPQFASAAASSQNPAASSQTYQDGQNTNWQHEFSDFLDRQARLPPNGGPGFDRRLSPAWSGLKLPS